MEVMDHLRQSNQNEKTPTRISSEFKKLHLRCASQKNSNVEYCFKKISVLKRKIPVD